MNIIITILVILFIIGIIKAIWDSLKDIILGLLGIGIIIAAIVFLGPTIVSIVKSLGSLIVSWFPTILIIIVALVVLCYIINFLAKQKYRSLLSELDRYGIMNPSHSLESWQKIKNLGLVRVTPAGYVISKQFYGNVVKRIDQVSTTTQSELETYCIKSAVQFQPAYFDLFLEFLQSEKAIVPFPTTDKEILYLTGKFVTECEKLFLREGAATEDEFTQVCAEANIVCDLNQNGGQLAAFILDEMLSQDKVEKIWLADLKEHLYVAKSPSQNCKMTRREISLD